MKTRKAQKLLKKINALLEGQDNKLEAIERDLLLSYLRQLYEMVRSAEVEEQAEPPEQKATPKPTKAQAAPEKTTPPPREKTPPKPKPTPQQETAPTPKAKPKPKPQPQEKPQPKTTAQSPAKQPELTFPSEELEQLFELPVAKELSEKLSTLPIRDLNKAMGLNEKIFTIKELFGDDQELFNETLNQLNGLSSFAEAKQLLVNLAQRFSWTDKARKKKAKNFIKLVSRRYK